MSTFPFTFDPRTDAQKQQSEMASMQADAMAPPGNEYADRGNVDPLTGITSESVNYGAAIQEAASSPATQSAGQDKQRYSTRLSAQQGPMGGRYSNADWMPAGPDADRFQSAGVGRYGADILPMPQAGILPLAVIGGRLDAKQKELAAEKAKRAQFDAHKLKEVDRAWANETFTKAAYGDIDGHIENTIAYYAGDEATAYEKLMDPNSREGRLLAEKTRSWNNIAGKINDTLGDALKVVNGTRDGTIMADPETTKLATEFYTGLGDYRKMSPEKLSEVADAFENRLSMVSYLDKRGVVKRIHDAAGITADGPNTRRDPKTGLLLVTTDKVSNYEQAAEGETDAMYDVYKGMGMTKEEVRKFINHYAQTQVERDVKALQPPAPKGGDGGSSEKRGWNAVYAYGDLAAKLEGAPPALQQFIGNGKPVDMVRLAGETSGQGRYPAALPFQNGAGEAVNVHPLAVLEDANGKLWVYGKQTKNPNASVARADQGGGDLQLKAPGDAAGSSVDQSTGQYRDPQTMAFDDLPEFIAPYKDDRIDNAASIQLAFPGMTEDFLRSTIADGRKKRGTAAPAAAAPAKEAAAAKEGQARSDGARWSSQYGWVKKNGEGKYVVVE